MKRFKDLTTAEFKAVVAKSNELREKLSERIQWSEMNWIEEKLRCFNRNVADWSIGFYNCNYFEAAGSLDNDSYEYVECIEDSVNSFGSSERLEKLLNQCKKLFGTNLYMHHVKKLYELYFKEELQSVVDDVEKISYDIYCGDVDSAEYELEFLQEDLSEWLYDESDNSFYEPHRIAI